MAKILFIEDNETQISIIKFLKLRYNHDITWATNVESALENINSQDFDFYIIDIMMNSNEELLPSNGLNKNGRTTGILLIKKINELKKSPKILVLSARDDLNKELENVNILSYFIKPTSPHTINNIIEQNIN